MFPLDHPDSVTVPETPGVEPERSSSDMRWPLNMKNKGDSRVPKAVPLASTVVIADLAYVMPGTGLLPAPTVGGRCLI